MVLRLSLLYDKDSVPRDVIESLSGADFTSGCYVGSILVVVPTNLNFRKYFMADLIWTSFIGAYQIEPSWPDSRMNKIEKRS
jgi:hypothetical protein